MATEKVGITAEWEWEQASNGWRAEGSASVGNLKLEGVNLWSSANGKVSWPKLYGGNEVWGAWGFVGSSEIKLFDNCVLKSDADRLLDHRGKSESGVLR